MRIRKYQEVLLTAGAVVFALAVSAAELKPREFGSTAMANIDFWSSERGYVGNPNMLGRRDRTIFNFDLSEYLWAGKVTKGTLHITVASMGLPEGGNEIVLEAGTGERPALAPVDVLSQDVNEIIRQQLTAEEKYPLTLKIDVTAELNRMLMAGRPAVWFRLRNDTVERLGNRFSAAEGVTTAKAGIALEVEK